MTDDLEPSADAEPECTAHVARVVAFHPLTGEPDDRGIETICDWAVSSPDVSAIPVVVTPKPENGAKPEALKGIEVRFATLDSNEADFFLTRDAVLLLISMAATALNLTERIDVSIINDEPEPEPHRGAYL